MIQRIQLYKLVDAVAGDEARRRELSERLRGALAALEGPREVWVGLPADAAASKSWDLSLVFRFDDHEKAKAFVSSATYRAAVDGALGGLVVVEKGWAFEV